jgi:5-methyltetrahydropteroyltriglutamate--homocysteine methyltransferase
LKLTTTIAGSYPRIGDKPDEQALRRAIAAFDKGEKTAAELAAAEDDAARAAIREQEAAGIELVTDGLVRWYDPVSHIARKLGGIEIGGLLRFFDTNFYYREPQVRSAIAASEPVLARELDFAKTATSRPVKVVMTGPATLARHSNDRHYGSPAALAGAYAEALIAEVGAFVEREPAMIQVDEPSLLRFPSDASVVKTFLEACRARLAGSGIALALHTYFGEAGPLFETLQEMPVDVLGFDFTYDYGLVETIAAFGSPKTLCLGFIDGRSTRLETAEAVLPALEQVMDRIETEEAYLAPSCGLEYLPRDHARAKLARLVEIRDEFVGAHAR